MRERECHGGRGGEGGEKEERALVCRIATKKKEKRKEKNKPLKLSIQDFLTCCPFCTRYVMMLLAHTNLRVELERKHCGVICIPCA